MHLATQLVELTTRLQHMSGNAIVDYSLRWAKIFLSLEDDKKGYARAKLDCREGWDMTCPVEGSSMKERRVLSNKRFRVRRLHFLPDNSTDGCYRRKCGRGSCGR